MAKRRGGKKAKFMGAHLGSKHKGGKRRGRKGGRRKR
jgi:hypothetical protein